MIDLKFRQAVTEDAALIAQMNQQLIRDTIHRNPMSIEELENRMISWLRNESKAFLFFKDETPVGYALFRPDSDWIYLRQFFVLPEFRRQGIARAAITWLRSNIWKTEQRLRIEVLINSTAAISFWHAVGFKDYALTMELENNGG